MLVEEKTKINFLMVVTNEEMLEMKVKNINFLFPIVEYSVGFLKTFSLKEIHTPNSFVYINRILDTKSIQNLKKELKNINKNANILGICFTDLGILKLIEDECLSLQLIYMQNHNTTNATSINYYLEYVDSVLISTDITLEEINCILNKAKKPLVVPYFSLVDAMYSRRTLLTNYQENFHLELKNMSVLREEISNNDFLAIENEYGTVFYQKKFIDYRNITHKNILYRYVNPLGLEKSTLEKILMGEKHIESDTGFLFKETFYRLREDGK